MVSGGKLLLPRDVQLGKGVGELISNTIIYGRVVLTGNGFVGRKVGRDGCRDSREKRVVWASMRDE
jgi:hypothetical protein